MIPCPPRFAVMAFAAIALAACAPERAEQPSFYTNLSSAGAAFDPVAARDMINALRVKEGLKPVPLDSALVSAANTEALTVSRRAVKTGRVAPSGNLKEYIERAGYPAGKMRRNVSAGYYTIAEAFSGWRESGQHRETLLMADATDMGIAAVHQPRAKYKVYWTLIMANRAR